MTMDGPAAELRAPQTQQEFADYYRLRYERLRKPHGQPEGSERDHPTEALSEHVIALIDGRVVGGCAWVVLPRAASRAGAGPSLVARLRQIAVDPAFEGRGIGACLVAYVVERCRAAGAEEIVSNVRLERVPFFTRAGFEDLGEGATLFGEVRHRSMTLKL